MRTLVFWILLALPLSSHAHAIGASEIGVDGEGRRLTVSIAFHGDDLPPSATAAWTTGESDPLVAATMAKVAIGTPAGACSKEGADVVSREADGWRIIASFQCLGPIEDELSLRLGYLADLPKGHRALGEARIGSVFHALILSKETPALVLKGDGSPGFGGFFALGVEHIFMGYDHLLFLAGLLLVSTGMGEVVRLVTSFTVAHSLTLALSVLGVWDPPGVWVEAAIAASIVFVAVENLIRERPVGRVWLTFAFGLVHGFGFAGLLREMGLGAGSFWSSLGGFNLGVEAGQLAVVAVVTPLILASRKQAWYGRLAVPAASTVIAFFGAYWLVERVF